MASISVNNDDSKCSTSRNEENPSCSLQKVKRKLPEWMLNCPVNLGEKSEKRGNSINTVKKNKGYKNKSVECTDSVNECKNSIADNSHIDENLVNEKFKRMKRETHELSDEDSESDTNLENENSKPNEICVSTREVDSNNKSHRNSQITDIQDERNVTNNKGSVNQELCDQNPEIDVKPENTNKSANVIDKMPENETVDIPLLENRDPQGGNNITNNSGPSFVFCGPCKYGGNCFRKNFQHKQEFSHPGDPEYDILPHCKYGTSCYRKNINHLKSFLHTKPAKRTIAPRPVPQSGNGESSEDDYDYSDPFINDDSSDDYKPGSSSESETEESQEIEQNNKRMLKEAKKFLGRKKKN